MTRLLLTGAGGFAGHHVLEHVLATTGWDVVATDSFRHKGRTDRISQVLDPRPDWYERVRVVTHDLAAPFTAATAEGFGPVDYLIAMASESHVDRSITDPVPFVTNNVAVALNTLELARTLQPRAVAWISTDEVYGPAPREGAGWPEWAPILPSNPYSASKAAQEALAVAWWRTYGVPVVIVNCMNMFGERQDPEKYIPKVIRCLLRGEPVPVHGRPGDIGSRHYLHARNLADALVHLLASPPSKYPDAERPERFNVASPEAVSNLVLAGDIAGIIGCPLTYELTDFHTARPGHDPHYGLDPAALTAAGWKAPVDFRESLERTVRWTLNHPEWLE